MRNKINAVYGYNAVHKIRITQSSPIAVIKKIKFLRVLARNKKQVILKFLLALRMH